MTKYQAYLTPSQLFVGTTFHQSEDKEDESIDEFWEQETLSVSYTKLKQGIESLGIKCLDIQFGTYDSREGTLSVASITCDCDGPDTLLSTLLTDEAYIETGIKCYSWDLSPMVAIYFKKSC